MPDGKPTMWVVRAGKEGEGHRFFLSQGCAGFCEPQLGDMNAFPANEGAFVRAYQQAYPEKTEGAWKNWGHEAYNLVHVMREGDLVLYPPKPRIDPNVYLGRISGPYAYDAGAERQFCHLHRVKWLKKFLRTQVSAGAQKQLKRPLTLYRVNKYVNEFMAMLGATAQKTVPDGGTKIVTPAPQRTQEVVTRPSTEHESQKIEHILATLARELDPTQMEEFVAHLLQIAGYTTKLTPPGNDQGVDVVAGREDFGANLILKAQVKSTRGTIGDQTVSAFYGKVRGHQFGLFVTLGTFTPQACHEADEIANLKLVDGRALAQVVLDCYPSLDPRYKTMFRL